MFYVFEDQNFSKLCNLILLDFFLLKLMLEIIFLFLDAIAGHKKIYRSIVRLFGLIEGFLTCDLACKRSSVVWIIMQRI